MGKRVFFREEYTIRPKHLCRSIYEDRECIPSDPENALKCFVASCVLSITFSLINLLTKTEKDIKAGLNLHIDTGYTESAITT